MQAFAPLLPVYLAYILTTASPGPSNMAIMGTAMSRGRLPALAFAGGVVTGSTIWALMAATGLSAVLASHPAALTAIRILGGLYLLFLAWKSARAALRTNGGDPRDASGGQPIRYGSLYRRGLLVHLTNPKAILGWISIMSLGLGPNAPSAMLPFVVIGCVGLGIAIFCSYALVFSSAPAVAVYRRLRRPIEGTIAAFFGLAGLHLLTSRG